MDEVEYDYGPRHYEYVPPAVEPIYCHISDASVGALQRDSRPAGSGGGRGSISLNGAVPNDFGRRRTF